MDSRRLSFRDTAKARGAARAPAVSFAFSAARIHHEPAARRRPADPAAIRRHLRLSIRFWQGRKALRWSLGVQQAWWALSTVLFLKLRRSLPKSKQNPPFLGSFSAQADALWACHSALSLVRSGVQCETERRSDALLPEELLGEAARADH